MTKFSYIWEFTVQPGEAPAFERDYGPEGDWARLFRRDPAYIRTDLHRDLGRPGRYVTIDHWTSREACRGFRQKFSAEFDAIDARCGTYTISERHLGDFELLD